MSSNSISIKWLIYAFIVGLSTSACFAMFTHPIIDPSPFPFIALFFAINNLYTAYVSETRNEISVGSAWIALFIGLFSYSAFIGALHPEFGSNFLSITTTLILGIWLMYKIMFGDKHYSA